jgi:uncharacterized SAM-binding protein YcdF (DUF218 family)
MTPAERFMRVGAWCLGCLILIVIALVTNIYHHGTASDIQEADAIIVLGAAQWDKKPSPIFQARLDRARDLFARGYATSIIVTGGKALEAANSDSYIGKEYLVLRKIDADRIFIEERSRTTLQNLTFARQIMEGQGFQSAIIVSHDFHIMRAQRMSRDLGITTTPAPVKTNNRLTKLRYAMREVVMHALYLFFRV